VYQGKNPPAGYYPVLRHKQTALRGWDVTATGPGSTTFYFSIRNDTAAFLGEPGGGWYAGVTNLCSITINWTYGGQINNFACKNTNVTPAAINYILRLHDLDSNASQDFLEAGGAQLDFDTFPGFGVMLPHHSYYLYMIVGGQVVGTPRLLVNTITNDSICMQAQCQGNPSIDAEPGQSVTVNYGLNVENDTDQNTGGYTVYDTVSPGLFGGPAPGNFTLDSINGGFIPRNVSFPVRVDYAGTANADLLYAGASIGNTFGLNNCPRPAMPLSRPTLKVTQGDIATGGGFANAATQNTCTAGGTFTTGAKRYISPFNSVPANDYNAGSLRTFAYPNTKAGSGADFAAYALGYIQGDPAGPNGFYTAAVTTAGLGYDGFMFANNGVAIAGNLGGSLGGDFTTGHCATDYFKSGKTTMTDVPGTTFSMDGMTGGQYYHSGNVTINGGTVANSRSITLYIDGDVTIANPINYAPWFFDTANYSNNSPYLTVIARGNIFVQNNVTTISGLYVAQPWDDGSHGVFLTCSNGGSYPDASSFIGNSCQSQLNVKGSVIAQHVYPLRAKDSLCQYAGTCPALGAGSASETFEYLPSMVVGVPRINGSCGGAVIAECLDSLKSLPPVF
jgi:hypothetical protein